MSEEIVKTITAEEAKSLGVKEIVMRNAYAIVNSDLESTKKIIGYIQDYISKQLNSSKDFRKDRPALLGIQLQIAALSLALEHWLTKETNNKIKVYSPAEMPKA